MKQNILPISATGAPVPIFVQKFINVTVVYTKSRGVKISDLPRISRPEDSVQYFRQFYTESDMLLRETMYFMVLNRSNRVLAVLKHTEGGIDSTVCEIRLILLYLIGLCASGVILCHNHPSGNTKPSPSDLALAKKMKEACQTIKVELLDSVILTDDDYYSMAAEADF